MFMWPWNYKTLFWGIPDSQAVSFILEIHLDDK